MPEALSRFYVDGESGRYQRVGATWMTREDRETDIADVTRYLDDVVVAACARADVDPHTVPLTAFGFSQGTATVTRWLALSPLAQRRRQRAERLILWGGGLPHDLDLAAHPWLAETDLTIVAGDRDEIATPGRVIQQEARLKQAGVAVRVVEFSGGHRLNDRVLRDLSDA